jgi:hypothetical protein
MEASNKYKYLSDIEKYSCDMISCLNYKNSVRLYDQYNDSELYTFARENLIDSIIGFRLVEEYGKEDIPSHWLNSYKKINETVSSYIDELNEVSKILSNNGIKLIALKNSGIVAGIYPYPGLVPMGDLDTLVKRSDFINAHNILENIGFKIASPNKFNEPDVQIGFRKGSSEYEKELPNGLSLWFELQWRPVEGRFLRPDQEPPADELVDNSTQIKDSHIRILSPEDNLLQVCLHTAKHSYVRAPGFRLHLDVDRIVNYQKVNWDIFLMKVNKHKVKTPVFFSLDIPRELFGTKIPENVLGQLQPGIIKRWIVTNWLKKVDIFSPHDKKFGFIGYLMWNMLLYDNLIGLVKAIFPENSWLKDRYGFDSNYLIPIYHIKRIIELIFQRMKT